MKSAIDIAKNFKQTGMSEAQAEAVAGAIEDERHVASTEDIAELKADIATTRADIVRVETELKADIATVKAELLRWLIPTMIGVAALIIAWMEISA